MMVMDNSQGVKNMYGMGMKMLPAGIENFEEICTEGYYYVDKTALIRELLQKRGKVNLFTRPRRFGKTLNMSMLRHFFEFGQEKPAFDGTEISKDTSLCRAYMGRFPAVSVSLKSVNGADYETARAVLCAVIGSEALRFEELLSSDKLSDREKELYEQLITVDKTGQGVYAMPQPVLMGSLRTLTVLLEKHYGRKVILLIDEYDVPLAKAKEQGYYDQMLFLVRSLFEQALKTNDSLYFAVLTGCLRISKESIFTGLNNMILFSITDAECSSYFGFTDDEVKKMLDDYHLGGKYEIIREWYDGYRFGDTDVYCPWDVISYVRKLLAKPSLPPQDYWSDTSSNDAVKKLLEKASSGTRDEVERLISGEPVWKAVREELTYKELYDDVENVWGILFAAGYLTQRGEAAGNMRQLAIPNREIHNIFMTQIREWMQEKARADKKRLQAFCEAFQNADAAAVQQIFTQFLIETVSVRDTAVRKELKENFYHGFLLGLLRFREDWKTISNRESGMGYADICIEMPSEKRAVVIELKYAENGNLKAGCRAAMCQIQEKGYKNLPFLNGWNPVTACGMACHGKECMAVFETAGKEEE